MEKQKHSRFWIKFPILFDIKFKFVVKLPKNNAALYLRWDDEGRDVSIAADADVHRWNFFVPKKNCIASEMKTEKERVKTSRETWSQKLHTQFCYFDAHKILLL